jgi:hypothetical protein
MKNNAYKIAVDILLPNDQVVSEKVYYDRINTCLNCPLLDKVSKICIACGCAVNVKNAQKMATCPKHKWAE